MRIAFFHNCPPGGARRVVYEQINELSKKHEIVLFRIKDNDKDFLNFNNLNCSIVEYNFQITGRAKGIIERLKSDYLKFFMLKKLHRKIAEDIDKKNFDCIVVHPDRFTQAPYLLSLLKTKSIYYCEEWLRIAYEPELKTKNLKIPNLLYEKITLIIRKYIDKKNTISATQIFTNSYYMADCIRKAYGKNAIVDHLGVDANLYKPGRSKKNKVLFIGSAETPTGYDLLSSIIPSLKTKQISVEIVDLSKNILSESSLVRAYNESIATLCLGRLEPFGLTSIESMACQTPVIALNEGGYKETVINAKTGFLIGRNPKQLLESIITLYKNKSLQKKMGKNGREHVKKNFTWIKHIETLEKHL